MGFGWTHNPKSLFSRLGKVACRHTLKQNKLSGKGVDYPSLLDLFLWSPPTNHQLQPTAAAVVIAAVATADYAVRPPLQPL